MYLPDVRVVTILENNVRHLLHWGTVGNCMTPNLVQHIVLLVTPPLAFVY